jgi:signal transduction histidine kinase
MLGGVKIWQMVAPADGQPPPRQLTVGNATLVVSVLLAVLTGGLVDRNLWFTDDLHLLEITRESLQVATGALFFGAGLLHLSVWRVDRDETRGRTGVALVACGFVAPWITGFGNLIHAEPRAAILSPVTSAFVAVFALTLGSPVLRRLPGVASHPRVAAWIVGLTFPALLVAPFFLSPGTRLIANPGFAQHLALEITVACLWFSAAALLARRVRRTGSDVTGVGAGVLAAMGIVWLLRAAAVVDVRPWSVAAVILMAAVGMVVLSRAAVDFTESAEAGDERTSAAEEALATVAEAFDALDAERRDVTHDARNVILALSAASQTLLDHGDDLEGDVRNRLRRAIVDEVSHLGHLINPAPVVGSAAFDAGAVIRNVAELERLNGLGLTIDVEPCIARGRADELARVVRNLLVNARQHAAGSHVRVQVRRVGACVQVRVEDDGPGIPEALRREVFGRGVRGVGSVGTGLGLHVGRALMRQQGGTLDLEATTRGTCFILTLPLAHQPGRSGTRVDVPLPRSERVYA